MSYTVFNSPSPEPEETSYDVPHWSIKHHPEVLATLEREREELFHTPYPWSTDDDKHVLFEEELRKWDELNHSGFELGEPEAQEMLVKISVRKQQASSPTP